MAITIDILPEVVGDGAIHPTPEALAIKLSEYLTMCVEGRTRELHDGTTTTKHDANTVPTLTSAARYCGYASRQSWYDLEKMGPQWKSIVVQLREFIEDWYVRRGVSPEKNDNPMFMSMILQSKFGYAPAHKQVTAGDPEAPVEVTHRTSADVERALAGVINDKMLG